MAARLLILTATVKSSSVREALAPNFSGNTYSARPESIGTISEYSISIFCVPFAGTGKTRILRTFPSMYSSRPGSRVRRTISSYTWRAFSFSTISPFVSLPPMYIEKSRMAAFLGSGKMYVHSNCWLVEFWNSCVTWVVATWLSMVVSTRRYLMASGGIFSSVGTRNPAPWAAPVIASIASTPATIAPNRNLVMIVSPNWFSRSWRPRPSFPFS